ncbi:MAG: hypothetical protein A3C30_03100 [Candidatus Levybacteria bacterium RIFCSPHIGHO2_02_FULL_40_18]|nr:MAG: hypothetical protein A2869_04850 [Candidatus Levybacteria bacterium RIFCSPHIGHO2_01_FULL_40_58]OGH26540.1 MAG: hypothetical protein A3C30_03100 [Candidatus Levybacteria bacterium RIFCSPHIGHO2_02_FULL_40_18]OGH31529.1 MAG: hypothetical protein A3E43_02190 [Candidatus Levybacteria bacterium RIFCSPHIGHO2_12_FULL_40_31]OGH40294.1 MAG: hypothetical protein A2894_00740 [Candidatus Levybacteria bacterium RIFCSPLOWO2_01_FULL_40_64]OGH49498.1 MAG: hypothetical protein A3I54_03150 [Candidatus Lev
MKIRTPLAAASIFFLVTLVTPTEVLAVVQSLNSQTGQTQTFQNDSNLTISSLNNIHSLIWQGLLPISRGGTGNDAFTEGSIIFMGQNKFRQDNNHFFWDRINNRLGIGTSSPTATLDVSGNAKVSSLTTSSDATINTLTVGLGGGSVTTNATVGKNALLNNTTGARNTAVGYEALLLSNGFDNTAVGYQALGESITSTGSDENTAVGAFALGSNTTGRFNSALGGHALLFNETGDSNTAVGLSSLGGNTSGSSNIGIGLYALTANTTGSNNIAIGERAGLWSVGSADLTAPSSSIYIGYRTRGYDYNDNNSIVIGSEAEGAGSNKAVIGNTSVTDVYFGSSAGLASIHSKKLFLGSSSVPGCIIMGDSDGSGVSYITVNDGVLSLSTTTPTACQ